MKTHKTFIGAVAIIATMALALAPIAYGQGSSIATYGGQGGSIAVGVEGGASPVSAPTISPNSSANAGALPFTGFDLVLVAAGGMVLLVSGLMMWIASRPDGPPSDRDESLRGGSHAEASGL